VTSTTPLLYEMDSGSGFTGSGRSTVHPELSDGPTKTVAVVSVAPNPIASVENLRGTSATA
jgi:hypothetical protein